MRRSAARLARFAEALALAPSSSRAGRDGRLVAPSLPREWRPWCSRHGRDVSSHATRSSPAPPTDLENETEAVITEPPTDATPRMRFASGLSKREDLSLAVVEAVAEVKARLGHDAVPTFVQVMVSSAYADPAAAPAYVMECFTSTGGTEPSTLKAQSKDATTTTQGDRHVKQRRPALFGGTATGAIGGAGAVVDGFGVSVFAGVMPNVEAVAFHVADASLPSQLTKEQWRRIFSSAENRHEDDTSVSSERKPPPRVAALMLACADFRDVETFTGRLHAAAPGAVVVGAVAKPGGALFFGSKEVTSHQSGEKDSRVARGDGSGAEEDEDSERKDEDVSGEKDSSDDDPFSFGDPFVFPTRHLPRDAADKCASHGAVGVMLVGDFEMEAHSLHANRPVGPPMTLTRAGDDGIVLDLDGRAAGDALAKLLADLPEGVAGMPVMLGMRDEDDDSFRPTEQVRRDDSSDDKSSSSSRSTRVRNNTRGGRSAWIRGRVVDEASPGTDDTREETPEKTRGTNSSQNSSRTEAAAAEAEKRASRKYGSGGAGYVYRDIVGADHVSGGVFVGSTYSLREGSIVQLHVRDSSWGKKQVKSLLKQIADKGSNPGEDTHGLSTSKKNRRLKKRNPPAGAVMYTCVSGNRMHAGDFREAVFDCPLGGGFVAGEIAPPERGTQAALQSHTSVVAVFREPSR